MEIKWYPEEQQMSQGWNRKENKKILKQTKKETQYTKTYGMKQKCFRGKYSEVLRGKYIVINTTLKERKYCK